MQLTVHISSNIKINKLQVTLYISSCILHNASNNKSYPLESNINSKYITSNITRNIAQLSSAETLN
jgi:hypothetical protein